MRNRHSISVLLATVILLLALPMLSGCSFQKDTEDIFNKTIHDFEGYPIANLDASEDTNFAVYAKDVQEIKITEDANILVKANTETLVYTFASPDSQLRAMKQGDVFWAEASAQNPNGLVVKVSEVVPSGDKLMIYGDRVAMEDLFVYVDIDMDMPLSEVYYDLSQMDEGMEIQIANASEPHAISAYTLSAVSGRANDKQITPLINTSGGGSGAKTMELILKKGTDISLGKTNPLSGGYITFSGDAHLTMDSQVVLRQVWVRFQYSFEHGYFFADISLDAEESASCAVEFEGSWSNGNTGNGIAWPLLTVPIPYTPLTATVEVGLLASLSGSMKGEFRQSTGFTVGASNSVQNLTQCEVQPYYNETGSDSQVSYELDGEVEIFVSLRGKVEIFSVANVFLEGGVGARLTSELNMLPSKDPDCIHDCDWCLDGDIDLFYRVDGGVDAMLLADMTGYDLSVRKSLSEGSAKIGDFYASYRRDVEPSTDVGMGECPHKRWKTIVTVLTEDGESASGANVRAQCPDGRTFSANTNSAGTAELYLPNGDNLLNCSYRGESGSAHAVVDNYPTSATLRLADKRQIFIGYHFPKDGSSDLTEFDELNFLLAEQYSDAVWLTREYTLEEIVDDYGLSPGDLILDYFAFTDWRNSALVDGENLFFPDYIYHVYFRVGIALLPEEPEEGSASDIPEVIWLYLIDSTLGYTVTYKHKGGTTALIENPFFRCDERYWDGLEYDSDYRIQTIGTELITNSWDDPAPSFGAYTLYDFLCNAPQCESLLANYATRAFPYIDLALEDRWEEVSENVEAAVDTDIQQEG